MADETPSAADRFEPISEHDSKSLLKPRVPALVVSNSDDHGPNVMTAAWWMLGGYNPFRYVLAVDQREYTHQIIQENPEFVLATPTTEMVDALSLCGSVSGRDIDKIEHLGLETIPGEGVDVPLLADAVGNIECRVLETFAFEGCTYFIAGVENAYVQPDALNGRILSADASPLAFMGSDWDQADDDHKYRYYLEFEDEHVDRYHDADILETLPDDVGE